MIGAKLTSALCAVLLCSACGKQESTTTSKAFYSPTATEIFNLRSKCAELAQKVLEENIIGSALAQSQLSHYNPETNRCYVELTVHTADLSSSDDYYHVYLYDGQTRELLAAAQKDHGQRSGMVHNNIGGGGSGIGWDDTTLFIDRVMGDDHKK